MELIQMIVSGELTKSEIDKYEDWLENDLDRIVGGITYGYLTFYFDGNTIIEVYPYSKRHTNKLRRILKDKFKIDGHEIKFN